MNFGAPSGTLAVRQITLVVYDNHLVYHRLWGPVVQAGYSGNNLYLLYHVWHLRRFRGVGRAGIIPSFTHSHVWWLMLAVSGGLSSSLYGVSSHGLVWAPSQPGK